MAKHKRQHYIPLSYLQAWCDPRTPPGQTPYIWLFSKDGSQVRKKAPKKIFLETDMYTILMPDGNRDLHLEYNLSRVEREFAGLRRHRLAQGQSLTPEEHLVLCMFVAAMFTRTKAYAKHQSSQWQRALDMAESIQSAIDNATPEERGRMTAALSVPHTDRREQISLDDVRELVEKPVQSMLSAEVIQTAPLLYEKPFVILETIGEPGFITSDDPCVWFDPAYYQNPKPFGAGGLIPPTLEITVPLSPHQMLFFGGNLVLSGVYLPIDGAMVDSLNRRTWESSDEFFVSNRPTADWPWLQSKQPKKACRETD